MGFESIYPYKLEIEIHQFPVQAQNQKMVVEGGGGVDGKMYLMTSLEMIFYIAFMFSPISISGGGGYIS